MIFFAVVLLDNGCDRQKNWNPYQENHGEFEELESGKDISNKGKMLKFGL